MHFFKRDVIYQESTVGALKFRDNKRSEAIKDQRQ